MSAMPQELPPDETVEAAARPPTGAVERAEPTPSGERPASVQLP